ncbi:MAG: cytochrome c [Betaproteobacteria bacterium]|nr:cytochrome c [Betaproteobacteria bacterium]
MKNFEIGKLALGLAAAVAVGAMTATAHAGDAEAGKAKIGACAACHGNDGKATAPIYPNIGGQNEQYLVEAIKAYKSGARNNPIMKPMASMLSDTDVENVAAYYASQNPCK